MCKTHLKKIQSTRLPDILRKLCDYVIYFKSLSFILTEKQESPYSAFQAEKILKHTEARPE